MGEILLNVKLEIYRRGRKIRHLAEALNMNYGKLTRILNGYDTIPVKFDWRVLEILKKWDSEDGRTET
jgi:hypothetical protein